MILLKTREMLNSEKEEKERKIREQKLVKAVEEDFKSRQAERMMLERQWELNMNFFSGNQYCDLNSRGELVWENKTFYWQKRGIYNHIAPLVESRMAKFSRVSPTVYVRPKSDDDKDVAAASLSEKVIAGAFKRTEIKKVIKSTTAWSETCGTGFYKIVWDNEGGNAIGEVDGKIVYEGDVKVLSLSPFEIFPDSLYAEDINDCSSIIHAKAVPVSEVYEKYGVKAKGREVGIYNLNKSASTISKHNNDAVINDAVLVIEKYEKKSKEFPNGRLITVADGMLLYDGELPYINGENGERGFPFVKQVSQVLAGSFFGTSIIERLIPVQRAFNTVKNRKHEFLNRLSMGIMTVEDGSVDVDDLEEEGLSPGKVLVYRQGSKAPELLSDTNMPDDFNKEEEKLLNEFVVVSGVSDVSSSSSNASVNSGSALEILIEQDNTRLLTVAEEIRRSYLEIARHIVRLYAQFTVGVRRINYQDEQNKTRIYYADEKVVKSDDVYLESENELLYTHSQKKDMVFKLFESGILFDEQGKLRKSTKEKLLSLLGYKELDYQKGMAKLQEEKAQNENEKLLKNCVAIDEIDDDYIHIDEHTRFVLSEFQTIQEEKKVNFYNHIREHKERIKNINGEK